MAKISLSIQSGKWQGYLIGPANPVTNRGYRGSQGGSGGIREKMLKTLSEAEGLNLTEQAENQTTRVKF